MANNLENAGRIKTVAMDFDGVITSLDINWKAAIRQASAIASYDIRSLNLFYEESFGTPLFQKVSSEMEKIELEAVKKSTVLLFVKESLQKLVEKDVGVYVVSMQSFGVVKEFLSQHGLNGYFKGIITREKCSGKKAQVQCLLKETGHSPSEVLLIDDSKRNIDVCGELGVSCFHFQNRLQFNKEKTAKEKWNEILSLVR